MMVESLIIGILEIGFIYGIMAMGVYITYTILDFPDLSADGTFPLGVAITFVMINNTVNPWMALIAAFAVGCIAGAITGIFNVKLKIRNLLCGILTMTALYSVNYGIVGKASDFLGMDSVTIFSQTASLFGEGHLSMYSKLIVIAFIAIAAKFVLDWYLRTKSGFLLRSVGDNEGLVITLAKNPGIIKIIGLAISNGLVALSGSVYCQYSRAFNVGGGTGTVVMGLAAVIIGATVFKKVKFIKVTTGVLFGMILYRACISVALKLGLPSQNTNIAITVLFVITLMLNEFMIKKNKAGVNKNA